MGKITILPETTIDPISLMGRRAGICWGKDITDSKKTTNEVLIVLNLITVERLNL